MESTLQNSALADNSDQKVLIGQVQDLYRNLEYANWAVILISCFLVWILWPVSHHQHLLNWHAVVLIVTLIRQIQASVYFRTTITPQNVKKWLWMYIAGVFFSGISWGAILVFVVPTNLTVYLVVTAFLLGGLVTGSAASLASLKYGFAVFSIPAMLPGALYLIFLGERFTFMVGCSLFVFLVFILFIALRMHKTIYYSLRKQVEISSKLSTLEVEKAELQEKVKSLELQVAFEQEELERLCAHYEQHEEPSNQVRYVGDLNDERFMALLDTLEGGVWDMNLQTGEMTFSSGWFEMLGLDKVDLTEGRKFWEGLLHPDDKLKVLNKLEAFGHGNADDFATSYRLKSKGGDWVWVMARANGVIWNSFGDLLHVVGMEIVLPESGEVADKTLDLVDFDLSAKLLSREEFDQRLGKVMRTASLDDIEHSLCVVRMEELENHGSDDQSLSEIHMYEIGRLLWNECRQGDAITRLDTNSYALIMEFCKSEDAWDKAIGLQSSLKALQITYKGKAQKPQASFGITPITSNTKDLDMLMRDADQACEMAATETSNNIYILQKDSEGLSSKLFEKLIHRQINDSIENDAVRIEAIKLRCLSDASAATGNVFALNVMLDRETQAEINALDANLLSRHVELTARLDRYVLSNLLAWINKHRDDEKNLYLYESAGTTFLNPVYQQYVKNELEKNSEICSSLCFGVSEKVFVTNAQAAMNFIRLVSEAGCEVALTEAGSTALSVKALKKIPVQYLKIDRSLIQDLERDESNYLTIRYINDIIHLSGLKSIVENVNARLLPEALRDMHIDFVQDGASKGLVHFIK